MASKSAAKKKQAKPVKAKAKAKPTRAAKAKPVAKAKRVAKPAAAKSKAVAKPKTLAKPAPAPAASPPITVAVAMAPMPVVIAAAPAPEPAPKTKAAKPAKVPSLVNQRRQLLNDKTLPELKAMLRTNEQITTGTKGKLVKRILDCVEHGSLPRCPTCGLGRLKFNKTSGYRCPGGYDDDEYVYCSFTATPEEITRPPWQFEMPGLI